MSEGPYLRRIYEPHESNRVEAIPKILIGGIGAGSIVSLFGPDPAYHLAGGLTAVGCVAIGDLAHRYFHHRALKRERSLDEIAKSKGAEHFTLAYKDNDVECVMRFDYNDQFNFKFASADPNLVSLILDVRKNSIEFEITTEPIRKQKKLDYLTLAADTFTEKPYRAVVNFDNGLQIPTLMSPRIPLDDFGRTATKFLETIGSIIQNRT